MDRRKELLLRVYIVFFGFILFSGLILYQVFKISFIEGNEWRQKAEDNLKWELVKAERGDIFAEDGGVLATDVTFFDIYMDLTVASESDFRKNIDSLSYLLSVYSNKKKSKWEWKNTLQSVRKAGKEKNARGTKYYPIASGLDYMERNRFENFPLFRKGQLRGGIIVTDRRRRAKPYGASGSRLIGMDRENADNVGIEASYDEYLSGESQEQLMKKISRSVWVPYHDPKDIKLRKGYDITTTIDSDIQDVCHNELMKAVSYHAAQAGTAIVMDVKTGAIKAMSNLTRKEDGSYSELQNHAVLRLTEPGSTIKLASALALIESGAANPDTKVDLNLGKKKFYDLTMYDSEHHGLTEADLRTAFAKSSNVGLATLANDYFNKDLESRKTFIKYYKSFGIGSKTGIDLIGERVSYLKDPVTNKDKFFGTSIPWLAHGYELEMTPLQVLNFYNTVANDGKMMTPYLVKSVQEHGTLIKAFGPKVLKERIASLPSIHQAQDLLEEVVKTGTARRLKSEHYTMAGKTGTSKDYGLKRDGEYPYNASFVGYFPAHNPQYSIIVVVYDPSEHGYYGGSVAGPVFKGIADKIFALKPGFKSHYYKQDIADNTQYSKPEFTVGHHGDLSKILNHANVPFNNETSSKWVVLNPFENRLSLQKRKIKVKIVPNVRGMGIRDALYVLENLGMKVEFSGQGKVISQSIDPGTKIKGQVISVRLG